MKVVARIAAHLHWYLLSFVPIGCSSLVRSCKVHHANILSIYVCVCVSVSSLLRLYYGVEWNWSWWNYAMHNLQLRMTLIAMFRPFYHFERCSKRLTKMYRREFNTCRTVFYNRSNRKKRFLAKFFEVDGRIFLWTHYFAYFVIYWRSMRVVDLIGMLRHFTRNIIACTKSTTTQNKGDVESQNTKEQASSYMGGSGIH